MAAAGTDGLLFTRPYLETPGVIVVQKNAPRPVSLTDLAGKKVAAPMWQEVIRRDHPAIDVEGTSHIALALRQLSLGAVDAIVGDEATAVHAMEQGGFTDLCVGARSGYVCTFSFASRADWPLLASILDNSLAWISPAEGRELARRWLPPDRGSEGRWRRVWGPAGLVSVFVIALVCGVLVWNRSLKRQVQQRTRALNGELLDRKHAEEEREQLISELEAKNAEMERFLYTVSHDLKSPLITIKGFLGMVEKDAAAGDWERLKADMARINSAAERMQRLLEELLQLSRIGRRDNPPERVAMADAAREAAELVAGRINARGAKVDIASNLPTVYGDRARLVELLQNLLDNAVKFMGAQLAPHVEVGIRTEGAQTVFYVRDNGLGVPPEYREKVFDLFDKLDPDTEGTGVGLALAKRIVETHGGRLWVESEGENKGATFCFTLPGKS
jgi:signal transduction histidine kinase